MKKLKIILIFLTFSCVSIGFGQTASGTIIYKIQLIGYGVDNKDPEFKELNEATVKIANQQTCTLNFNSTQSSSVLDKYLCSDAENNRLVRMATSMAFIVTNESDYFFDKLSNTAVKRDDNGNLIKKIHNKLDWEITTESKVIDGYLCYKAIYYDKFINRKGVNRSIPIVAWFAPSLPYGYGPKYFNGLPGLILELNDRETTFYATSIKILRGTEIKIDFPKGKTVSQEQHSKKVMSN
ncbi:GLPGLI family protein [Flavobacterium xanthum]|uniref:GLPGLI family protein n=1 Tax=Flavobacterium xanthum TaxID=69322 RepID=A0A1M7AZU1_9FLAO|nr:GLPGLI family protein [Flavobacterium xanthum]SHL48252.1 GLPGLI family protein [Flavobacterium xanthum]